MLPRLARLLGLDVCQVDIADYQDIGNCQNDSPNQSALSGSGSDDLPQRYFPYKQNPKPRGIAASRSSTEAVVSVDCSFHPITSRRGDRKLAS